MARPTNVRGPGPKRCRSPSPTRPRCSSLLLTAGIRQLLGRELLIGCSELSARSARRDPLPPRPSHGLARRRGRSGPLPSTVARHTVVDELEGNHPHQSTGAQRRWARRRHRGNKRVVVSAGGSIGAPSMWARGRRSSSRRSPVRHARERAREARQVYRGLPARFCPAPAPSLREVSLQLLGGGRRSRFQPAHLIWRYSSTAEMPEKSKERLSHRGRVCRETTSDLGNESDGTFRVDVRHEHDVGPVKHR